MPSQAIALRFRVTAKQYADAVRQLHNGNANANPLARPIFEQGEYILSSCGTGRITLMDMATGRHYSGSIPTVLAHYLAGFQLGRLVLEDHEFELMLEGEGD